jgi:hypothetical protein
MRYDDDDDGYALVALVNRSAFLLNIWCIVI